MLELQIFSLCYSFIFLRAGFAYCSSFLCIILKSTATTSTTTVKPKTNPAKTRRSTLVDKHLFPLARCCPSSEDSRARKQSRNVDPRSEAKPEEGHCSLSWFLCHTQSAFLYDSVLTSVATSHSGLDLLPSIISHDNVQQTGWTDQCGGSSSSAEVLSSLVSPVWVMLTKNNPAHLPNLLYFHLYKT